MSPLPDHGEETYRGGGRLAGKVAIVTGGDSGIGRAATIAFAREGADVLVSYLPTEEDAQDTVRHVEAAGRRAVTMPGDISEEAQCRRVVARAVEEFGRVDVLVNNASYQGARDGIGSISGEEFHRVFKTNVYAVFYLSKAALEHMGKGASIVNTCSVDAYGPLPQLLDYSASKGAVVSFTKGLAQETIRRGIRVNAVAPGPVWTLLIPATMPEEFLESFGSESPAGRPA